MLGCSIEKVCDELWLKDEPPLEEVLNVAKKIEHSLKCVEVMKNSSDKIGKEPNQNVLAIQQERKKDQKSFVSLDKKGAVKKCFSCDREGHFAIDKCCPVLKEICSFCKKRGHFAAACRVKKTKQVVNEVAVRSSVQEDDTELGCGQIILQVGTGKGPSDIIKVEGEKKKVLFDSGAKITIIANRFYQDQLRGKVIL
ncbi:hypothetical protein NDU88_001431 [Pleurodeles waltl]|uniref:CCHC-type domain-containing protein n=1 Tax=Pleurodeles waltl TaxID=8319 RepID=A0AAV7LHE9_PLEWA|nr:hypothetical protein NDU88_001431 [Pleurodeles waltl]